MGFSLGLKPRWDKCSGKALRGKKMKEKRLTKTVVVPGSAGEKPEMDKARVLASAVLAVAVVKVRGDTEFHPEGTQEPGTGGLVPLKVLESRCVNLRAAVDVAVPAVAHVQSRVCQVEVYLLGSRPPTNVSQCLYAGHVEPEGGLWGHRECGRGARAAGRAGHGQGQVGKTKAKDDLWKVQTQ
ncbi:hypothetical protein B0H16DRAFT_1829729 [Mycena metata]|uniref:Uncharacterized protein n=1 Tax=Mycena metata TaxID=1033252 RepID=A0AAD7K6Z2_9AGAR|nr:hypothetical protein B0H16DRAFT_1829729 [Mycena metata]